MSRTAYRLAILFLCAAGLAPVTAAQAQWNGANRRPPPLYPYELQPGQPYAVEVAPGTYVIHRGARQRAYPYVGSRARPAKRRYQAAPKSQIKPKRTHADRRLIEELRRRHAKLAAKKAAKREAIAKRAAKRAARKAEKPIKTDPQTGRKPDKVIHTKRIVREKPVVIETRRVINHPPKVVTRRHYVDDPPPPRRGTTGSIARKPAGDDDPRVIHADAEITILGPDRMSIRLLRKDGQGLDVNARLKKAK